jgi:fatty-acyl-CoA synthase
VSDATILSALWAAPADRAFVTLWQDDEPVESVTFGAFRQRVDGYATAFQSSGLGAGDTVALIQPHSVTLMACFVAAMRLGAMPSILACPNDRIEPSKYRSGLLGIASNLSPVVVTEATFPSPLRRELVDAGLRVIDAPALAALPAPTLPPSTVHPDAIAFVQHSSGTTGLQKGVALTHRQVLTQLRHLAEAVALREGDRVFSWLPLYHDMGLVAGFLLPMACHIPLVTQSPTEWVMRPATMLSLISEYRCTLSWTPNFSLPFMARRVDAKARLALDLSSLRMLVSCSEPVREADCAEFRRAFEPCGLMPEALQTSYALAENVFAATQSGGDGRPPRVLWVSGIALRERGLVEAVPPDTAGGVSVVSCGRPLNGTELTIASESGAVVGDGEVGAILLRGECVFDGYYNRPDLTSRVLIDGWLHTGDLGFTFQGELFVTGRRSDRIIVAGKNLYPADIEDIAGRHPRLHDGRVVAFGVVNEQLGTEDIVIVAEAEAPGDLAHAEVIEAEVRAGVFAELAVSPRRVHVRPRQWIVKSTSGKLARDATRAKLLNERNRRG